jgi:hypothetical protein
MRADTGIATTVCCFCLHTRQRFVSFAFVLAISLGRREEDPMQGQGGPHHLVRAQEPLVFVVVTFRGGGPLSKAVLTRDEYLSGYFWTPEMRANVESAELIGAGECT